jgi:hypothetical protein
LLDELRELVKVKLLIGVLVSLSNELAEHTSWLVYSSDSIWSAYNSELLSSLVGVH